MDQENRFSDPESEADADYYSSELEAVMAEIERVTEQKNRMWFELSASQVENVRLRGNLENIGNKARIRDAFWVELTVAEAIATPSDTSALEAMIAKAGEKMRERMIASGFSQPHEEYFGDTIQLTIRALPAVTLEDLK